MLTLIKNIPFDAIAWPGMWIWVEGSGSAFEVAQFSRITSMHDQDSLSKLHVSADNRYKLYLDGELIGLGPQRGDIGNWFFDTYDLRPVREGHHVLTVIVWHDRDTAPSAQISARPALLLVEEATDGKMNPPTKWKCRHWANNETIPTPEEAINAGPGYDMAGFTLDELVPNEDVLEQDFKPIMYLGRAKNHRQGNPALLLPWQLRPRTIPALVAEMHTIGRCRQLITKSNISYQQIDQLISNSNSNMDKTVSIPPHTHCRFLLDAGSLTVGYPILRTSKGDGSIIRLTYQEALQLKVDDVSSKANRDEIENRVLVGLTDSFHPDGRDNLIFEPFWYRCWRYIEIDVITINNPLNIHELKYRSTGYPLELNAEFETDDWFKRLIDPGFRTLRLCAGETFMDCPYYEQLQYEGDALIQSVLTYVLSGDDRLPKQAIEAFSQSRIATGLTLSRYPCRFPQIIPTFSLLHIMMLNDFLMWRGDPTFVHQQLDSVTSILCAFKQFVKNSGLVGKLPGMTFIDWASDPTWKNGAPLSVSKENSFITSFLYLYALQQATDLYKTLGHISESQEIYRQSTLLQALLQKEAFDSSQQVFTDDPSGQHISQHTNILAILTDTHQGIIDGQTLLSKLLHNHHVSQVTYYFTYFLFEAMFHVGRADLIWPALQPWHAMLDNGLTTFAETPEPTRSDCHAWSAHPLYHFFASVLGVRPKAPGCSRISIKPAPRNSDSALPAVLGGTFMVPQGRCYIRIEKNQNGWRIHTKLPNGVELESE